MREDASQLTVDDELVRDGTAGFTRTGIVELRLPEKEFIGAPPNNFVGVLVEGPSRIGHYFRPVYGTSDDKRDIKGEGPLFNPDSTQRTWSIHFDPKANDGQGRITATLDNESVYLDIPEAARKGNATFDHFGIVSWQRGGHYVEMYFDDVVYTSAK